MKVNIKEKFLNKPLKASVKRYQGIIILFILQLILTITIKPIRYDDAFYINELTGVSISDFVRSRYFEWTSRILIETTLGIIFKYSGYLWIIGNVILTTLIGYSILKLFTKKTENNKNSFMVLLLVLLYPFERMSSAGWAATTVNYIWPMSLGLISLISIKKAWNKEKIKPLKAIVFCLTITYACNQEQCASILFLTYILFTIILTIRDKSKVSKLLYLETFITIISLIFIITTPGNSIRKTDEIVEYFPEYNSIGIVDKLVLGITSTMGELLVNYTVTFAIFTFIIFVYIWTNYKDVWIKAISVVPFVAVMVLSYCSNVTLNIFSVLELIRDYFVNGVLPISASKYTYLGSYVIFVISLIVIFCIFLCLLLIFKKLKNNIAIYVFGCGLVTRLIMGFSPTIFVSSDRTFLILEFACIICTYLIWQELNNSNTTKEKHKILVKNVIILTSTLQYLASLSYVLITHINV